MIAIYKTIKLNNTMKPIILMILICFFTLSCKRELTEYDFQKHILSEMSNSKFYKSPGYSSNEFLVLDKDSNLFYIKVNVTNTGTECFIDKKQFILSLK